LNLWGRNNLPEVLKQVFHRDVYKTTKPDLMDNLQKGLFDAMEGVGISQ
jgi:Holliday junction resolvase RusA-like endonuclease